MAVVAALVVLIVGDFGSTFFYHVPQHLWFTLHLRTHHDARRSYADHAVISGDPWVLLDGLLGALPYLAVAVLAWQISPAGAIFGLALGQLHVWWRHSCQLGWRTPAPVKAIAQALWVVVPEDHDRHHRNPWVEFGDIFRFYDAPARGLLAALAPTSRAARKATKRIQSS
jgi:hypothetical protein